MSQLIHDRGHYLSEDSGGRGEAEGEGLEPVPLGFDPEPQKFLEGFGDWNMPEGVLYVYGRRKTVLRKERHDICGSGHLDGGAGDEQVKNYSFLVRVPFWDTEKPFCEWVSWEEEGLESFEDAWPEEE